ncbi:MAG TPA: sugar ABC transporter permease [Tepidisphaeraceae bacterium]|jgi:multiple sugar transport system permease protein
MTQTTIKNPPPGPLPGYQENQRRPEEAASRPATHSVLGRKIAPYLFLVPYGASFLAFIVLPFVIAMVLAFMQFDLASQQQARFIGFKNFGEAWNDPYFWKALSATLNYVVLMVPASLIVAMLLALGMHAMTTGRHIVRATLFLPGMLNVAVAAIMWQWFYNSDFGLFNFLLKRMGLPQIGWLTDKWLAMPSIVIMSVWWTVGGTSVVLLAGLQQIPPQLWEAAAIDGATRWQSFWRITLPMLKPVLMFVAVINTIGAFQVFGQPFLLTRGGPELTTRGIVQYIYETAFQNYRLGYGAAMSWLLFAIIGAFSYVQYRLIRRAT